MLLSEYDLKQILLIEKKIFWFEINKLDLPEIICDLEGLINVLQYVSDFWKEEFRSEINSLEIINDSIEDGSISKWKGNYQEDIHNGIKKLKKMIISMLEEYLGRSDSNILEKAIIGDTCWLICPKCNDAWESDSLTAMVVCPKCCRALHNPRATQYK